MGEYNIGLCQPWVTVDEFLLCCDSIDEDTPPEIIEKAIMVASNTLYLMSGKKFKGTCQHTVTVCKENCTNTTNKRRCLADNEIELGYWPITDIISITFDGEEQLPEKDEDGEFLTDSNFRINDYRYLEKLDGPWPVQYGQDYQEVVITLEYGVNPPDLGVEAAKALASEIAKACLYKKDCQLPDRAIAVSRRGVTYTLSDYKILQKDFLGITLVDIFLQAVNPTKARMQSMIIQPGKSARTRRIGT